MRYITVVAVPARLVGWMGSGAMLAVGDQVDRFVLEEELGSGGMARVFKARHVLLQTEHALKILSPELVANESIRQRFLAEAEIQARLSHPNVVRVRDILALPGVAALVMDFIPAKTLSELIGSWSAPPDSWVVQSIFLQLLEGIGAAHRLGIVHRDIKPSNVLIEDLDGRYVVHIIDFGIAKWAGGTAKHATATGIRMGTPAYMSPEQIRGAKDVTARSDIFSLGVTLYELATLHTPFQGDSDFDIQTAVVHGDFLDPMKRVSNIDPLLAEGIRRALAPDPDLRFASCAEFAEAICPAAVNAWPSRAAPPRSDALPTTPPVARHAEPEETSPRRPLQGSSDRRAPTTRAGKVLRAQGERRPTDEALKELSPEAPARTKDRPPVRRAAHVASVGDLWEKTKDLTKTVGAALSFAAERGAAAENLLRIAAEDLNKAEVPVPPDEAWSRARCWTQQRIRETRDPGTTVAQVPASHASQASPASPELATSDPTFDAGPPASFERSRGLPPTWESGLASDWRLRWYVPVVLTAMLLVSLTGFLLRENAYSVAPAKDATAPKSEARVPADAAAAIAAPTKDDGSSQRDGASGSPPPHESTDAPRDTVHAGLEWQPERAGRRMDWADANSYCAELSLAGDGWRLPTKDELLALYRVRTPGDDGMYWSSSSCVSFYYGKSFAGSELSATYHVRCVR